jgi:hypothetical protein
MSDPFTFPSMTASPLPESTSLGPDVILPPELQNWRILFLVTAVNSFAQRALTYLKERGLTDITVHIATDNDEEIVKIAEEWKVDLIICPFLTRRIPTEVFSRVSPGTLLEMGLADECLIPVDHLGCPSGSAR